LTRTVHRLVLLASAAALTACGTVPMGDAKRSAELKKFVPNQATGQIYVCRDSRFLGAAVTPTIELNGKEVGKLGRSNYFFAELPPGEHTVVTKTIEHDSKFPFNISAGQQIFFSTWISFGIISGRGIIDTVSAEDGKKCVTESELVGPLQAATK
jgi:Protein of unknown function (DUF2846)